MLRRSIWIWIKSFCLFLCSLTLCSVSAYAEIIINGKTYKGSRVEVKEGRVIVDGDVVEQRAPGHLVIEVQGAIEQLSTDRSVEVKGDLYGSVNAKGRVNAHIIHGDVKATGSVRADQINGDIDAVGHVRCN